MTESSPMMLFVCTGNICRSPYLEFRLRAALAANGHRGITITSAGTGAAIGRGVSDRLADRLHGYGVDSSAHRGRQLTTAHVESADVVLTAGREHRRAVTQLDPTAVGRAFTVRQFLRLLSVEPSAGPRIADLVAAATDARGRAGASTDDDDIDDPWRRSRRVYARVAGTMDEAVTSLVAHLVPGASPL